MSVNPWPIWLAIFSLLAHGCSVKDYPADHTGKPSIPHANSNVGGADVRTPETADSGLIWAGTSGNVKLEWSSDDLLVRFGNDSHSIFTPLVKKGFEDFTAVYTADDGTGHTWDIKQCSYERTFKVLSVAGTLISFEDDYYDYCGGAHPSRGSRFTAVDLAKVGQVLYARKEDTPMLDCDMAELGRIALLSDYFTEQDILHALLADTDVKEAVTKAGGERRPRKLSDLPRLFAGDFYQMGDSGFELRPDFLTRFAFHHVEGDKVAVQLSLPSHYGADAGAQKVISILLPIPPRLWSPLEKASRLEEGFLLKDSDRVSQGRVTQINVAK